MNTDEATDIALSEVTLKCENGHSWPAKAIGTGMAREFPAGVGHVVQFDPENCPNPNCGLKWEAYVSNRLTTA